MKLNKFKFCSNIVLDIKSKQFFSNEIKENNQAQIGIQIHSYKNKTKQRESLIWCLS